MQEAKVEITWATPSALVASFVMVNHSPEYEKLVVGFPIPGSENVNFGKTLKLTISFDGRDEPVTSPSTDYDHDKSLAWIWYHCTHSFRPGKTEVIVRTTLPTSDVYDTPYQERLAYCVQTGGSWAGNIGEEDITIRFPGALERGELIDATPAGYQIDGDRICWKFTNFKPKGNEFDVAITYERPDVMRIISAKRIESMRNPGSSSIAIGLAKDLLALGYLKSNSGFLPWRPSQKELDSIAASIATPRDRALILAHYKKQSDGTYQVMASESMKEHTSLIQILADAGYRDDTSKTPFILEGERLLREVIKRDPKNAEAWNVYLANFYRFSFAALGSRGPSVLSKSQAEAIQAAAGNCPNDECIKLWAEVAQTSPDQREKPKIELWEATNSHGYRDTDFP